MGRSYTPTYRLEWFDARGKSGAIWDVLTMGRPSIPNLERYVLAMERSFEAGGANSRLSERLGYVPYANKAQIVRQKTDEIVVEWTAPAFRVVGGSPLRE